MGLDKPADVLAYGIETLDEAVGSRIGDGIKRKLAALASNWNVEGLGAGAA